MDLHLHNKVVVITGGTDGLGAALARGLLVEGARVA
ncbi:MAG: short-chain dehydrogenase, partial [Actinomycetota bacterium]|nr:short-chain dehydrogenase [Actinomycetota bacterium]